MERGARTAETRTSTWSWSMITQTRWRSRNIERSDHGDFSLPGMETRASHEDRQSWSWSGCGLYVDVKQRRQQILDIVQRKGSGHNLTLTYNLYLKTVSCWREKYLLTSV